VWRVIDFCRKSEIRHTQGIPELEEKQYVGKIKDGNVLPSVHMEDGKERDRAKKVLEDGGAEDISYTGEASVPNRTAVSCTSK
jgi:hypothetical protein